jgi:hypothetical protein
MKTRSQTEDCAEVVGVRIAGTVTNSLGSGLCSGRAVPVVTVTEAPVRGLSHQYKSKKGMCSQRSRLYAEKLSNDHEKNATTTGKKGKRFRGKQRKIDALKRIYPCLSKAIPAAILKAKPHLFSNQTNSPLLPVNQFDIVDETDGCCMKDSEGKHIVFLLLPRKAVLAASGKTGHLDIVALESLSGNKSTARSPTRDGIYENNYSTTGLRANRGGHGIVSCKFGDEQPHEWNRLIKMMKRCQALAAGYLPNGDLHGLTEVMGLSECKSPMPKVGQSPKKKAKPAPAMFAGLANAMNYCSPAHTDEDFFYSVFTANVKGVLPKDSPSYSLESPIVHYFCFPEYGIALALRAGDVLLFSPQNYHCLSQKEAEYGDQSADVYVTSFYLKTAVVCKNDNRIMLNEEEEKLHAALPQKINK